MNGHRHFPTTDLLRTLAAAFLLLCGVAACKPEPEPAPAPAPPASTAPAGVRVTQVEIGSAIGPDKRVTAPTRSFAPGDTFYVAVETEGSAARAELRARWTYEDGQVVDESTQSIAPTGPAVTEFHVAKPDGWPAGGYRVEILLDGASVASESFSVAGG